MRIHFYGNFGLSSEAHVGIDNVTSWNILDMVLADVSWYNLYTGNRCPEDNTSIKSAQSLDNCILECDSDPNCVGVYFSNFNSKLKHY